MTDLLSASITDNDVHTVGQRLAAEINKRPDKLDVVTGYLTPGIWSIVGNALDQLSDFRLLLGKDHELERLRKGEEEATIAILVREAIRKAGQPPGLPTRLEAQDVEGLVAFLKRDTAQVKVWTDGFLHAKAYILDDSQGVGSANFTAAGLRENKELVAWRQDRTVVAELQAWFDRYWSDPRAEDYKDDLIELLQRSRFGDHPFTPYDVFIKTLAERYGLEQPPSLEQASFDLKWFQEDAVFRLVRLLDGPAGGALLADAVGFGKTFMALGVIHHFLYQRARTRKGRGKPIALLIPASLREMWARELADKGFDWACELVTLQSLRTGADVEGLRGADLVIVDEAHRLRGGRTWFHKVMEIVTSGNAEKKVLLLTATPLQTSIRDLTNLLKVITKNKRNVWAPAIADFETYLKRVERRDVDPFPLLDRSIVRRSRSDLFRMVEERRAAGLPAADVTLPARSLAHAKYQYYAGAGSTDVFDTFVDLITGLNLAPYDIDRYIATEDELGDVTSSLSGLYRAGLLKRFESSLRAIRISLTRLKRRLDAARAAILAEPPKLLDLSSREFRAIVDTELAEDEDEAEPHWERLLDEASLSDPPEGMDRATYVSHLGEDLDAVERMIAALPDEGSDGKISKLLALLTGAEPIGKGGARLGDRSVLVFTQYRDSAKYLMERLSESGLGPDGHVLLVCGDTPAEQRKTAADWFDPNASGKLLAEARIKGLESPRILIATDVLAEGHNLQLAQAVINFDLHWNPQVAVQRAGRIDRLNSPHDRVFLVSFEPDEGIEEHLALLQRLEHRFGLIQYMGMGDESVTKLPGDVQSVTFDYLRRLYGDEATVLDEIERAFTIGSTDYMRAPLEAFLRTAAEDALDEIPLGVQSARRIPERWEGGPGAFIAFKTPLGETVWRFYPRQDASWGPAVLEESELFHAIACGRAELRAEPDPIPPGPGGLIDWGLLAQAAAEVADEVNRRAATADVLKGASERSARLRAQLRDLAESCDLESEDLTALLDRLEEVAVEDFDHRPEYKRMLEGLRRAKREDALGARRDAVAAAVVEGLDLLGTPQEESVERIPLDPSELTLVSWELLVSEA